MPVVHTTAQPEFLPALAIDHPAGLSPMRALGELSIGVATHGGTDDGDSHPIVLRQGTGARGRDVGPNDYPRPARRYGGPRPAQCNDLSAIRYRPSIGRTV